MQLLPPLNESYTAYLEKGFTFKIFCLLNLLRQGKKRDLAKPQHPLPLAFWTILLHVKWFECMRNGNWKVPCYMTVIHFKRTFSEWLNSKNIVFQFPNFSSHGYIALVTTFVNLSL